MPGQSTVEPEVEEGIRVGQINLQNSNISLSYFQEEIIRSRIDVAHIQELYSR